MKDRIKQSIKIDWQKIKIDNIDFFETKYSNILVSKCGKVYSIKNKSICKPNKDKDGYCRVITKVINNDTVEIKTKKVHRIICERFLDNYSESLQVNHKDYNKQNNNIDNLEMVDCRENNTHRLMNVNKKCKSAGVSMDKNTYISSIQYDKKYIVLGRFKTESEAANEYQRALKELKETGSVTKIHFPKQSSSHKYIHYSSTYKKWIVKKMGKHIGSAKTESDAIEMLNNYNKLQNGN
jgi:hypothetical protein